MVSVMIRIAASILVGTFFCLATMKMLGAMQQSGYKGSRFIKWLFSKDNLYVAFMKDNTVSESYLATEYVIENYDPIRVAEPLAACILKRIIKNGGRRR